jgi:hypothetical protein
MKTKLLPKDPYGLVAFAEALAAVLAKRREELGTILSKFDQHPGRSLNEASRQFIDVAATLLGEAGKLFARKSPTKQPPAFELRRVILRGGLPC